MPRFLSILQKSKELRKNDPYFELSFGIFFSIGDHWADDNPISKFHSLLERGAAFSEKVDEIQKDMESRAGKKMPELHLFTLSVTALGFSWADRNPPKYC